MTEQMTPTLRSRPCAGAENRSGAPTLLNEALSRSRQHRAE